MTLAHDDLQAIAQLFDQKLNPINERFNIIDIKFDAVDKRFDSIDKRMDSMDKRMDSMDKRMDSMNERMDSMNKRFDSLENRLEILELKQNRTAKKLDDLAFSVKASERNIRHDIRILQDEMGTVIEVLKQNELIPQ